MSDALSQLGFVEDTPAPKGTTPEALGFKEEGSPSMGTAYSVLRGAGKGLDYQRGAVAVGLDKIAQLLGAKPGMSPQQASTALDPTTTETAPSYRDLLQNWGVPAGPSTADIPHLAGLAGTIARHLPSISARNAVGTAADMGFDPLAYEGGALEKIAAYLKGTPILGKTAAAAANIPSAVSDAGKAAATELYESGIKPAIQAGKRYGNEGVGKTFLDQGIRGGYPAQAEQMQDAASSLKAQRDAILQSAGDAGATGTPKTALDTLTDKLQTLVADQRLNASTGQKILLDLAKPLGEQGPQATSPMLLSQMKTDVRKALPGSTFDELATRSPTLSNEIKNSYGAGLRQASEGAVASMDPDQARMLSDTNSELGNLINPQVQKAVKGAAIKSETAPWLTRSELFTGMGLGGAGAAIGHTAGYTAEGGLGVLGTLAAIKAANHPATRTTLGWAASRVLNAPGVSPLLDAAARRAIVDRTRSPYVIPAEAPNE